MQRGNKKRKGAKKDLWLGVRFWGFFLVLRDQKNRLNLTKDKAMYPGLSRTGDSLKPHF